MLPRSPGGWLRSPPQLCALSGGGWGAGAGLAPWESSRARENQAPWPRDPRKNVSSLIPWFSLFPASPLSTSVRLHRKCLRFCLASPPFFVRTPQEGLPRPPPRGPHQGSWACGFPGVEVHILWLLFWQNCSLGYRFLTPWIRCALSAPEAEWVRAACVRNFVTSPFPGYVSVGSRLSLLKGPRGPSQPKLINLKFWHYRWLWKWGKGNKQIFLKVSF